MNDIFFFFPTSKINSRAKKMNFCKPCKIMKELNIRKKEMKREISVKKKKRINKIYIYDNVIHSFTVCNTKEILQPILF